MYEILMLRLDKDKETPMICNSMQIDEVVDFVISSKDEDPSAILDLIEVHFDCRKVNINTKDPLRLKVPENKPSLKFILYVSYNNKSDLESRTLFGYPTLEHARIVGNKLITEEGTVEIYESETNSETWGYLKLVETIKYKD